MFRCSKCNSEIPPEDFNISTDLAYCRKCNLTLRCSDLADIEQEKQFNLDDLPRHIKIYDDGRGEVLRYKRIPALVFFFVPFTLIWGVMTTASACEALVQRENFFDALFSLPFILVTLILLAIVFYMFFGKTELREQAGDWCVFTGIGAIGRHRRFTSSKVAAITCDWSSIRTNGQSNLEIVIKLKGGSNCKFGAFMDDDSREYIVHYLKRKIQC